MASLSPALILCVKAPPKLRPPTGWGAKRAISDDGEALHPLIRTRKEFPEKVTKMEPNITLETKFDLSGNKGNVHGCEIPARTQRLVKDAAIAILVSQTTRKLGYLNFTDYKLL